MALNISIDVDGTLLDENENLIPQVREKLLQLKPKRHRLQLWSTGGADYAYKTAVKHNLTDLFDSYGTKPDVAVDDIPEGARPVAVLKVDQGFRLTDAIDMLQSKLEDCVESVLHPSPALVNHVGEIQRTNIPQQTRDMLGINPVPIPFFGNVDHARIVTVGLNPSSGEFAAWRKWKAAYTADDLTHRLVNYFRLANVTLPPAHVWFGEILEASHNLGCPHGLAAAHVDLCPWATVRSEANWPIFWNFIDAQMNLWFGKTIERCKNSAKLVVIVETDNPTDVQRARQEHAKSIIRTVLGPECEIVSRSRANLPAWTWDNRARLGQLIDFPNVIA
jgi:hypothetical protein